MRGINKVILIGNLGADPELRKTGTGGSVCNLRLATSERWKDKEGKQQEHVEWHRVTCWGESAEHAAKYLSKGDPVYVEGSIRTQEWTDKDGVVRKSQEVRSDRMVFLPKGGPRGDAPRPEKASAPADSASGDLPF